ncbi:MAG: hypothetical protein Q8Q04_00640 [archaeon]|nr:hypothetical protein [archaeon]
MQIEDSEFIFEFKKLMENLESLLSESTPPIRLNGVDTPNYKINGVKKIEN